MMKRLFNPWLVAMAMMTALSAAVLAGGGSRRSPEGAVAFASTLPDCQQCNNLKPKPNPKQPSPPKPKPKPR
jgi:hypothetical protein